MVAVASVAPVGGETVDAPRGGGVGPQLEMASSPRPCVDVVVPVHNEARTLATNVTRLRRYLDDCVPYSCVVTIVDNASTDDTWQIARSLERELPGVRAMRLEAKGRGRALRAAWSTSEAEVVAYMDVDLSTDLDALTPLLDPVVTGRSDLAVGSRLAPGATVVRGPKRELISRAYNALLRACLRNTFSDAQCGFKALRARAARRLLPGVADQEWFFDTELLVRAERSGLRIHEVPVAWKDDPDSRVHIVRTAWADLRGIWRVFRELATSEPVRPVVAAPEEELDEVLRYTGVGALSTFVCLASCLAFATRFNVYACNAVALFVCSIGNIAAHTHYTFAGRGPFSLARRVGATAFGLAVSLAFTTAALEAAMGIFGDSRSTIAGGLLLGTALAALVRLVAFRAFIFRSHDRLPALDQSSAPHRRRGRQLAA